MGDKVEVDQLTILDNSSTINTLNNNFGELADEFDSVVYRDGSLDMTGDLNMDTNRIINLSDGVNPTDAVNIRQVDELIDEITTGPAGAPGSNVMSVSSFADIPDLEIPVGTDRIRTANGADYVYDVSVDAAYVLDFPLTAAFTANNRGFRLATDTAYINILHVQDNTVPDVTDFRAAFLEALRLMSNTYELEFQFPGAGEIVFPTGNYYISDQVFVDVGVLIRGVDVGGPAGNAGHSTVIRFPINTTGFYFRHSVTTGTTSAAGSHISNLYLRGSGTSEDTAGIFSTCRIFIEDVGAEGFGNGIHIHGELNIVDPPVGEASLFRIKGGRFISNRNAGIKITGGDANIFLIENVDVYGNANWGIENVSFLGGVMLACHSSQNGLVGVAGRTLHTTATHAGRNWAVVIGYEATASTEEPGTGLAWSSEFTTEGLPPGSPAWTSGLTWKAGGAYLCLSPAGNGNLLDGCYSEGGQGPTQLVAPAFAVGGTHGAGVIGLLVNSHDGAFQSSGGMKTSGRVLYTDAAGDAAYKVGTDWKYGTIAVYEHSLADGRFQEMFQRAEAHFAFGVEGETIAYEVTSPATAWTFGRSAAQVGKVVFPELFVGAGNGARSVTAASTAPTTGYHAQGEVVYNIAADAGGFVGWYCTVSGEPGTWNTFGPISV
jgi:hypothetical protein